MKKLYRLVSAGMFGTLIMLSSIAKAQFGSNVQGNVEDPRGAAVAGAMVTLENTDTQVKETVSSDASGNYIFVSLAPGPYRVTAEAKGFSEAIIPFVLKTNQRFNLPIKLEVGYINQSIQVTSKPPVLDTADSRNQMTLDTQALVTLPLPGRNMIGLVTMAPGVVGKGAESDGSPGSGIDNYATETQVDASANGQGSIGNMFIVDGLDISSSIAPGVLNLTPNPDSIQETTIETNTYNVEYGRATSIEMTMSTKSGTDAFHGNLSDYFINQDLVARTEFTPASGYSPFHSNNISATIGGPIIPLHQSFFFFAIEPLLSTVSTGNRIVTFEAPEFTAYAQKTYPNTVGTKLLSTPQYQPAGVVNESTVQTASQVFPGTCETAATNNIPCTLPMIDQGVYNVSDFHNGDQWNTRLDKYFKKDRLYATLYWTTLSDGGPQLRPAFTDTNLYWERAYEVNETHTFSPNLLNEAIFGESRVEGNAPATGTFYVPIISVTGMSDGLGDSFAAGDYIQQNFHWRDVLTKVRGAHDLKFGFEGMFGTDIQNFAGVYDQPHFQYNNLLDLAEDNPYTETSVAYNPLTGLHAERTWNAAGVTWGAFAEDSWKLHNNLTINYGVRWDDFGNPYSRSATTALSNFYYGPGQTLNQKITNGFLIEHHHALNRSLTDIFSPRIGVAWDPTNKGILLVHGGAGIYHNWPTLSDVEEEFEGNPPGPIVPTFYQGTAEPPLLTVGNSNTPPFGFIYPTIPALSLNAQGGITGLQFGVGGINPELKAPTAYVYTGSIERQIFKNTVVSAGYSGSRGMDLLAGIGQQGKATIGVDINRFPGDLILNNSLVPTRLNHSFGVINYAANNRKSGYNAMILGTRGQIGTRSFFNASYTISSAKDNVQVYPTDLNPAQYYSPSVWDARNRVSFTWSYQLPNIYERKSILGRIATGWVLSGTAILQSGYPFTVLTNQPLQPTKSSTGTFTGYKTTSGDYNADGDNLDYPNVISYSTPTSRQAYLKGLFSGHASGPYAYGFSNFPLPVFGQEGNEKYDGFRGPGYAVVNAALLKDTKITQRTNMQFRFELYNLFNRANLGQPQSNISSGTFGRSTGQSNPRFIQLGANFVF